MLGDAHTHLGLDEDGMAQTVDELLASMAANGVSRALTFPLHDPERAPAYRVPNDRVLAWAAASGGRLVPLARLDLNEDPIGEARARSRRARAASSCTREPRRSRSTIAASSRSSPSRRSTACRC